MRDPGLDRHNWETEWEQLAEELETSPAETLPELADLVERMLRERDIPVDDAVADDGVEPEFLVNYRSGRETASPRSRARFGAAGSLTRHIRRTTRALFRRRLNPSRGRVGTRLPARA
jgi:hypothetical protein